MDVKMFIAICYQAYSEAVNRDGFFGLKPRQEDIDTFWNREIAPRIVAKYQNAQKVMEEQAKQAVAKAKKEEKNETTTETNKKNKRTK